MRSCHIMKLLAAAVLGLTLCLPMLDAGQCTPVYHAAAPACHPAAPAVCREDPPVFVSPFTPLDVFVFVGVPQPAIGAAVPAQPPAGGPAAVAFPRARGYAGSTPEAPAAAFDVGRVAEALNSCVACHTAPSGKGGVNIFAARGAFDPKVSPAAILASVQSDRMPLRGVKLTPPQKQVIAEWVAATSLKGSVK